MTKFLAHEKVWLRAEIDEGIAQNQTASTDMAAAIEAGNQWHDNAEYDEVIERMKLIDSRFGPMAKEFANREVVPYPEPESDTASLGTLLTLKDEDTKFNALLVGMGRIGEDAYSGWHKEDFPDADFEVIGFESPIGEASMGARLGDTVSWQVGERVMSAEVQAINNSWLIQYVGDIATAETTEIDE